MPRIEFNPNREPLPQLNLVETRTPEQLIADGDVPHCPVCTGIGWVAPMRYDGGDYWKCPATIKGVPCSGRKLTAQAFNREAARLKLLSEPQIIRLFAAEQLPALLAAEPLEIMVPANVAFLVHQYLTIALMGPPGRGPNGACIRRFAETIERAIFTSPILKETARRGWEKVHAAHPEGAPVKIYGSIKPT